MNISANGIQFIKDRELFTAIPKLDCGHWMWGYGHDQKPGETIPESITEQDASALLLSDLESWVVPAVQGVVPADCTQNQFDALCSFCYNAGAPALRTMVGHGWDQIPVQIVRWVYGKINGVEEKLGGLVTRRDLELQLFQSK